MESVSPSIVVGGSYGALGQKRCHSFNDESPSADYQGMSRHVKACQRTEEASSSLRPKNWI